jgi:hypothetical protein
MSAHVAGCKWDEERRCYTDMGEGCADRDAHRKWKHATFCLVCGEEIIYREERHRCKDEEP